MTLAVPAVEAVNVTLQLAVPVVALATSVQGEPMNEPVTPIWLKLTVPVGVVPPMVVTVTVAVQVEAWLTKTGVLHDTVTVVGCGFTMTLAAGL